MVLEIKRIHIDLFLSGLGVLLGFSSLIAFTVFYRNYEAGFLGGYSGHLALCTFLLHIFYYYNYLNTRTLKFYERYEIFGFIGFVIGIGFIVFDIFMLIYEKPPILPVNTSVVIRLVWAFMVFKWGLYLFFTTRRYKNMSELQNEE